MKIMLLFLFVTAIITLANAGDPKSARLSKRLATLRLGPPSAKGQFDV